MKLAEDDRKQCASEVVFVGSWMPERGPFMRDLLAARVPLAIWGDHWPKAPEYRKLRTAIRGSAVYGPDYVKVIQCAKVALGLLSRGNRDLHTTRSSEIPFIGGGIFCGERSSEHEQMFTHEYNAMLWGDAKECALHCHKMLEDRDQRTAMADRAKWRIMELELTNDSVLASILEILDGGVDHRY
jgi:hypothetical protein